MTESRFPSYASKSTIRKKTIVERFPVYTQITTVAQVINAQVKSTNRIYTIDDGTGRIEARAWLVGDDSSSDDKSAIK